MIDGRMADAMYDDALSELRYTRKAAADRIAQLEAENADLKRRLAELEERAST